MPVGDVPRPGTREARPVLSLDIDGVLNPDAPRTHAEKHTIGRLTVRIVPDHGAWLQHPCGRERAPILRHVDRLRRWAARWTR